jgi:hypothetical protein
MIVHVVDELLVEQLTRFSKKDSEKCKGIECLNVGLGVWRDGRTLNNQLKFRS